MTEASLFRKNLIFLDAAQPGVASLVRRSTDTITRTVPGAGGRAVDIDIGAGRARSPAGARRSGARFRLARHAGP